MKFSKNIFPQLRKSLYLQADEEDPSRSKSQEVMTGVQESKGKYFSPVPSHQSPVTSHQSPVPSHQSPVPSHQSPVTSHQLWFSPNYRFLFINHKSRFCTFGFINSVGLGVNYWYLFTFTATTKVCC
ncbi:hypothetical protein NIES73_06600 [Sphaerospermopsis kisseleviana NIES-73]|nr:hypothetical protein NIES73_06600 [Sphaerospermopsis kisseleviana NIES-73]